MYNPHRSSHPDYLQLPAYSRTQSNTGMPFTIAHPMLQMGDDSAASSSYLSSRVPYSIDNPYDTRQLIVQAEEMKRRNILRSLMNQGKIDDENIKEQIMLREAAMSMASGYQTNPAAAQAEEMERLHILRSLMNQRKIDDENMKEQIMLRDASMAAGNQANPAAASLGLLGGPRRLLRGGGMGLSAAGFPVPANGLDLTGLPHQATGVSGLGKTSLLSANHVMTKKKKKPFLLHQNDSGKTDKKLCSSPNMNPKLESSGNTDTVGGTSKYGSKKNKLLRRQLEQEEQDDDSNDDGSGSDPLRKKRKMTVKAEKEKQQQGIKSEEQSKVSNTKSGEELMFPSFLQKWQEIKKEVVRKHPKLSENDQQIALKGLFSDALHAGKIVCKGESWSGGHNISGMRSNGIGLRNTMTGFRGASSLCS